MLPNVETLARLLAATEAGSDDLAWPTIERERETVFPADYKEFLDLFGAGDFGDYLGLVAPFPQDHEAYKAGMRMVRLDGDMLENPFGGRDLRGTEITSYRHWNQPRH